MTIINLDDYYVGGYFLLKQRDKMCLPYTELPAECEPYSIAKWIAWTIPNTWGFTWATDERKLSDISKQLGFERERLLQMQQWVTTNESVRFGYPNVFLSYAAMHEFAHHFIDPTEPVRYVGIGYHRSFMDEFLESQKPMGNAGTPGVYQMLNDRQKLQSGGDIRGFDILCFEYTEFDSWLCPYLYSEFVKATGITLNQYGLLDNELTAIQAAKFAIQAEYDTDDPVLDSNWWQPWLVVDYTPTRAEATSQQ